MSTMYDPEKVRALAAKGDPFWKGAAWILDQQDAAKAKTSADHLREYESAVTERANELQARINATWSRPEVRDALNDYDLNA